MSIAVSKASQKRLILLMLAAGLLVTMLAFSRNAKPIYWGALIRGSDYGVGEPPWDLRAIDIFEKNVGKRISILHWGQPWWQCDPTCRYQMFNFQKSQYEAVRQRGYIPLVDWSSSHYGAPELLNQPEFSLSTIIAGQHDEYIRQWATQAKEWGHPFFLRFNWEMNGWWFPWSERVNGNRQGEYVLAWRHVHDIFVKVGARNVTWVWCPHVIDRNTIPLTGLYPGDEYVDWLCMDGYNAGTHPVMPDRWRSFEQLFEETYSALIGISPNKPIMIAETASTEIGGSKEDWIRSALAQSLPKRFPRVKAFVWFNWNHESMDWAVESSPAAQQAFAEKIASRYYLENGFSNLAASPIPPWEDLNKTWMTFWQRID